MAEPRDPSFEGLDWAEIRTSVSRRLSYQLRGWEPSDIEDATQDVVLRLMHFLRRTGSPRSLDGIVTVIARRTAIERIRIRSRRPESQPIREGDSVALDEATRYELLELEEEVTWKAFQVREFFRLHQTPCVELAEGRSNGIDFKQLAEATGQSHLALLQRWARCMKRLRTAIASRELGWDRSGGKA